MDHLNYHHLRLFWAVAREGNLTRASEQLCLTPQTVSTQIRDFEANLGAKLFSRVGRGLSLTDLGRVVLAYAEEIFSVGQELQYALRGQPTERPLRLIVGVANVLPKLIVHRMIAPAIRGGGAVRLVCREGTPADLLADLAVHHIDVVLSDSPIPERIHVKAYNHFLGKCGVSFVATPEVAERLGAGFPRSLQGEPVLLPTRESALRSQLDEWFERQDIRPSVVGEFEDSALMKAFGQAGEGIFAVPTAIEEEVCRQYRVKFVGTPEKVVDQFYAISVERQLRHPGIVAICQAARSELFAKGLEEPAAPPSMAGVAGRSTALPQP